MPTHWKAPSCTRATWNLHSDIVPQRIQHARPAQRLRVNVVLRKVACGVVNDAGRLESGKVSCAAKKIMGQKLGAGSNVMQPPTSNALCTVCNQHCPIYTCPRCATRTCSLPCSKSHKELQSCSGERHKTSYVPMNKYGWGTMANDYVYLEEVSRKAAEWGDGIVRGGFLAAGRGRRPGQSKETRSAPHASSRSKREVLKAQLDALNIEMEILPPGMNKRRLNQSTWDVRWV